ncbi:hypothetical protein [Micromonospora humidisoli]
MPTPPPAGVVAAAGLPYALLGGALLGARTTPAVFEPWGPPSLLLGSAALLVFGIVGYAAVGGVPRLFMAGRRPGSPACWPRCSATGGVSPAGSAAAPLTTVIGSAATAIADRRLVGQAAGAGTARPARGDPQGRPVPERAKVFVTWRGPRTRSPGCCCLRLGLRRAGHRVPADR